MKKHILPLLSLLLSALALTVAILSYLRPMPTDDALEARIAELEAQNIALSAQLEALATAPDAFDPYCELVLGNWSATADTLTLDGGYALAYVPSPIASAALVLRYNGSTYASTPLTLTPEDAAYTATLTGATLALPEMQIDEYIELYLELTLENGEMLQSLGASWFFSGEELFPVMG